jgi:hypothetical protein
MFSLRSATVAACLRLPQRRYIDVQSAALLFTTTTSFFEEALRAVNVYEQMHQKYVSVRFSFCPRDFFSIQLAIHIVLLFTEHLFTERG